MNEYHGWHFSDTTECLRYGDGRKIEVGVTHTVDCELEICKSGLHASERVFDALQYAPGPILWKVILSGKIILGGDKACATKRSYHARIDATNILWNFARRCALDVIHLWDAPTIVREYLETGNEEIKVAALAAARDAAWIASGAAAQAAAQAAAHAAAWAATRDAAWIASGAAAQEAAQAAAHAAAWAAARDSSWTAAQAAAQAAALTAAEAALAAAWTTAGAAQAAAQAAARDAAEAVARDARKKQNEVLTAMVEQELGGNNVQPII